MLKVLVMGASDTLGSYLPDPSEGTFNILARELPDVLHDSVEVSHMRFYSHFKNSPGHAAASVRERSPDITILAAHSMAFSTESVGARLVHLFGWKTGRWLERRIWAADAEARKGGIAARVQNPARGYARRLIGTTTYSSVEATIGHYAETVGLLARLEDMELLLLGTFQPRRDGEIEPHARLNRGLAGVAAARRIGWIDRQEIVSNLGADAFQSNGLYSTPLTHRKVADAVIASLARRGAPM